MQRQRCHSMRLLAVPSKHQAAAEQGSGLTRIICLRSGTSMKMPAGQGRQGRQGEAGGHTGTGWSGRGSGGAAWHARCAASCMPHQTG